MKNGSTFSDQKFFGEKIKIKAPLKVELVKYFSVQILLSIEYMSKLGIVHRDIKPDNYVIDKELQLKLVNNLNNF